MDEVTIVDSLSTPPIVSLIVLREDLNVEIGNLFEFRKCFRVNVAVSRI